MPTFFFKLYICLQRLSTPKDYVTRRFSHQLLSLYFLHSMNKYHKLFASPSVFKHGILRLWLPTVLCGKEIGQLRTCTMPNMENNSHNVSFYLRCGRTPRRSYYAPFNSSPSLFVHLSKRSCHFFVQIISVLPCLYYSVYYGLSQAMF
jgi:hypothetical protein